MEDRRKLSGSKSPFPSASEVVERVPCAPSSFHREKKANESENNACRPDYSMCLLKRGIILAEDGVALIDEKT